MGWGREIKIIILKKFFSGRNTEYNGYVKYKAITDKPSWGNGITRHMSQPCQVLRILILN